MTSYCCKIDAKQFIIITDKGESITINLHDLEKRGIVAVGYAADETAIPIFKSVVVK